MWKQNIYSSHGILCVVNNKSSNDCNWNVNSIPVYQPFDFCDLSFRPYPCDCMWLWVQTYTITYIIKNTGITLLKHVPEVTGTMTISH